MGSLYTLKIMQVEILGSCHGGNNNRGKMELTREGEGGIGSVFKESLEASVRRLG